MFSQHLAAYEIDAICAALRRDQRAEMERVHTDSQWAMDHEMNARRDRDLLEALAPKRTID